MVSMSASHAARGDRATSRPVALDAAQLVATEDGDDDVPKVKLCPQSVPQLVVQNVSGPVHMQVHNHHIDPLATDMPTMHARETTKPNDAPNAQNLNTCLEYALPNTHQCPKCWQFLPKRW